MITVGTRVATVAAFTLTSGAAAGAQSALPPQIVQRIDSVFAAYERPLSPGCALGVIRDGQLILGKGYGMSDLQHGVRITPASVFHVASISKQFAAMSILLLERDGKLRLDDDIRTYVPEVPDFGPRITIRHLIHHTSGLRDQWSLLSLSGWRADDPKSEADILWLVSRQRALNFVPGAEHLYSNTGYTLLGTIVRRVSGKSLREFTTERIFTPLGMTNTHFHDDHTMVVPGRTSAYVPRGGGGRGRGGAPATAGDFAISIPVFDNAGATSLFTTVEDMAKWERNFLQPTVGDARLIEQMYVRGRLNSGDSIPYAFALMHGQFRGRSTIGHSGADAGYRADFLRFPDQRYAFATLCNIGTANPSLLNRDVAAIVLAEQLAPAVSLTLAPMPAPREVALPPAALRAFAGIYLDTISERARMVVFRDSTGTLHPTGGAVSPRLVHVGNDEFVATQGAAQIRVQFLRDGGAVTGVRDVGASSAVFSRMPPPATARAELALYAGRYRSEELDSEWTISIGADSALTLSRRRVPDLRMAPLYRDGFNSGVGAIRFTRDAGGRVNGFLLSAGRIRHMRFDRTDAAH